jgi:hypothetical protein
MVRGADSKEYGPVSTEILEKWIREGRLQPKQEVRRSDMDYWAPAGDFTELTPMFAELAPASAANLTQAKSVATQMTANLATVGRMKSAASWYYWIAGLSLINSIAAASGSGWRFILGLGITQILDEFGSSNGGAGTWVALALDFVVAGVFILLGVFAHKAHTWAFIVGLVLFALDGLVFLLAAHWIGVAFHAYVLFRFFQGFMACRELKR